MSDDAETLAYHEVVVRRRASAFWLTVGGGMVLVMGLVLFGALMGWVGALFAILSAAALWVQAARVDNQRRPEGTVALGKQSEFTKITYGIRSFSSVCP